MLEPEYTESPMLGRGRRRLVLASVLVAMFGLQSRPADASPGVVPLLHRSPERARLADTLAKSWPLS